MKKRTIEIALAGLLHDIGKLEQRAKVDPWNPPEGISSPARPIHAAWTTRFVQTNIPKRFQNAALQSAYHHHPEEFPAGDHTISRLVALADKLSAGERADLPQDYPDKNPPQQMVSIYDRIALGKRERRGNDFHYLPLKSLSLEKETLFAKKAVSKDIQGEAYDALRVELATSAKEDEGDDETYLENLLGALQRTTWSVPSAYYHHIPDISLYDHSRMTSALAVALAEKSPAEIEKLHGAVQRRFWEKPEKGDDALLNEAALLLIGGDISGVQNFIYTISSKQAAKTLRGRSFYLQLLTEAILRYVLNQLELPYTNVIYSGGGHFFLLAPLSAKEQFKTIQKRVSEKLLKHHGTDLYLALGKSEVSAMDLQKGNFPQAWNRMYGDLNRAKKQKYTELGADFHHKVFQIQEHGGNEENLCSVCGQESKETTPIKDSDDKKDSWCPLCASFAEEIGKELPKTLFVGIGLIEAEEEKERRDAFAALREFGMMVAFATKNDDEIRFEKNVKRAVIWALDDLEKEQNFPVVKNTPTAYTTRYTVNSIPMHTDKRPLGFDELQKEAKGVQRLGVLRMDVDDLGDIFKDGLGENASLSRIATLSFQTTLFFEGWLKRICEREGKEKDKNRKNRIYAVYAGGDDLFLIGPWNLMPFLAQDIANDWAEYTGHNPDIHISGGIAFIGGKYPVYQAAEDAAEMLDMAKDRNKDGDEDEDKKNALAFLDCAWRWDEFAEISKNFELIRKMVKDDKGPKAIMQTLRELTVQKADSLDKNDKLLFGPWIWQGMYRITRMIEREKEKEAIVNSLKTIQKSLSDEYYQNLESWGTSARWAQVYTRGKDKN